MKTNCNMLFFLNALNTPVNVVLIEKCIVHMMAEMEEVVVTTQDAFNNTEVYECPICLDALTNDRENQVIKLECGHRFCRPCFDHHHTVCLQQIQDVICPMCRHVIIKNTSLINTQQLHVTPTIIPRLNGRMVVFTSEDYLVRRSAFIVPMGILYMAIFALLIWALLSKYG